MPSVLLTADAMDRVTSLTFPGGEQVNYTYNAQLLPARTAIQGVQTLVGGTTYNVLNLPQQVGLPYDSRLQPTPA